MFGLQTSNGALQAKLSQRVSSYYVSDESLPEALAHVAAQFDIPLGMEFTSSDHALPIEMKFANTTVGDLLKHLVTLPGGYTYDVTNGVFHVEPVGLSSDSRDFLNLRISHFEVVNEKVGQASAVLKKTVRQTYYRDSSNIHAGGTAGHVALGMGEAQITVRLSNVRVRDVLDKFVTLSHYHVWIVSLRRDSALTRAGTYSTSSMYVANVPEEYEPVWVLSPWGLDPETKNYRPVWLSSNAINESTAPK